MNAHKLNDLCTDKKANTIEVDINYINFNLADDTFN